MKKSMLATALTLSLSGPGIAADRVEESRAWTETFTVTRNAPSLEISNIWGDVRVWPGPAGAITLNVKEHRSAPDRARFERSLETLKLRTQSSESGVSMYVGHRERGWHGNNHCRGCRVEYRFDVLVPADTLLDVSTVNDGRVEVTGVTGTVSAANVNGPIAVNGLRNCRVVNSVNGEVSLNFSRPPNADCDIETVNGDITLVVPGQAGLDMSMDLFNGSLRSELALDPLAIPARVEHSLTGGVHHYRIDQPAGVRIAGGGPTFTVSSINGDIRIQKTN